MGFGLESPGLSFGRGVGGLGLLSLGTAGCSLPTSFSKRRFRVGPPETDTSKQI